MTPNLWNKISMPHKYYSFSWVSCSLNEVWIKEINTLFVQLPMKQEIHVYCKYNAFSSNLNPITMLFCLEVYWRNVSQLINKSIMAKLMNWEVWNRAFTKSHFFLWCYYHIYSYFSPVTNKLICCSTYFMLLHILIMIFTDNTWSFIF